MKSLKNRYHWVLFIACCLLATSSIGICINSVGIFYTPVSEFLGVGRGTFAFHTTLSSLAIGFCAPVIARMMRRYSAKLIAVGGVVLTVLATALMALSKDIIMFYALGLMRGIGCSAFAGAPLTIIIGNWFEKRNGFAIGFMFCFGGIGGATFNAVFSRLIENIGWQYTYLVMAATMLVLSLPAAFLIYYSPEELGLLPYGRKEEQKPNEKGSKREVVVPKPVSLRSSVFVFVGIFALLATSISGVGQHFPGFSETLGFDMSFGATMLSVAMIGNIVFKLIIGVLSDKFGPILACSTMIIINITALTLLTFANNGVSQIYMLISAFIYGTVYAVGAVGVSLVTRYIFGPERYAYVYGYVSMLVSVGSAFSLTIIGFVYDFFGTYKVATIACIVFGFINISLLQIIKRKKAKQSY